MWHPRRAEGCRIGHQLGREAQATSELGTPNLAAVEDSLQLQYSERPLTPFLFTFPRPHPQTHGGPDLSLWTQGGAQGTDIHPQQPSGRSLCPDLLSPRTYFMELREIPTLPTNVSTEAGLEKPGFNFFRKEQKFLGVSGWQCF